MHRELTIRDLEDITELDALVEESEIEGFGFVTKLVHEFVEGTNAFERDGEALLVAESEDSLVAVCGLNADPYTSEYVGRVRHLYVSQGARRRGIASKLVSEIVSLAGRTFPVLRLRTANPEAANFYESIGFETVQGDEFCTHQLHLNSG